MIWVTCPGCGAHLAVPEDAAAPDLRCEGCGHVVLFGAVPLAVPVDGEVAAEVVPPAPVAVVPPPPRRPVQPSAAETAAGLRPRPRRRPAWLTVGLAVLAVVGLAALGYFYFFHDIEAPVTAADRQVVITAQHLAKFEPTLRPDPALGKYRKVRHLDGSRELTYEYETPEEAEDWLYIECVVSVEPTVADARAAYAGLSLDTRPAIHVVGAAGGGSELGQVVRNDLWRWGDASRSVLLTSEGETVGNFFMARKGRRYFTLVIVGISFDQPEVIRQVLAPLLGRLESYEG
jgi:hypothetical protein